MMNIPERHVPLQEEHPEEKKDTPSAVMMSKIHEIKGGVLSISDQEKRLWTLVTDFPEVTMLIRIIVLVLNIFIPGTGTILLAFQYKLLSKTQLVIGLLQLLTFTMIIGWVWAIGWGALLLWKGMQKPAPVSQPPPAVGMGPGMVRPGGMQVV